MKKTLFRLLAGTMAIAMALTLSACGGDSGSSTGSTSSASDTSSTVSGESSSEESSSEVSSTPADSSSEGGASADGTYPSVQAFLDDPEVSGSLNQMMEAMANDSMQIKIEADGDTLIYRFTYSADALAGNDIDTVAATLESAMSSQTETFEGIASQVASVLESGKAVVRVIYEQEGGEEIYTQDFNSK